MRAAFGPTATQWLAQFASAPIVVVNPSNGCSPPSNVKAIRGNIALVVLTPGECDGPVRVKHAQVKELLALELFNSCLECRSFGCDNSEQSDWIARRIRRL